MTAYDEVPYDCQPIPCTAPEQLATASLFHGGPCPPIRDGALLEIGCGDGANLLALAFHRPDFRFVGVDASTAQIAEARRSSSHIGVANIALHAADIAEIGHELGTFDYIVAHGMMSWVSDEVRDQIFALCRNQLAPDGLLYLSYNTHPGWLARGLVRDTVLRRTAAHQSLREMAGEARRRADVLRLGLQGNDHPYARLLSDELRRVDRVNERYLIHEYLAEHNRAFWFRDFALLAAQFGFRYVAEAAFTERDYRVPPAVREAAAELERERLEIETLIDVLWFRQHRASLFCHADRRSSLGPDRLPLERMTVASGLRAPSDGVRLDPDVEESFTGHFEPEVAIELSDPLPKAALVAVTPHWPRGLPWERMLHDAKAILANAGIQSPSADDERDLRAEFHALHALGQVEFRLREPPWRGTPNGLPTATRLTRWEAERRAVITAATHHRLGLTPADRVIISHLDGGYERAAIVSAVVEQLRAGDVREWRKEGLMSSDGSESLTGEQWAERQLDRSVALLEAWGLCE
jgi:cyclopropane fatty-acyl-phospholipid synthase-like methyltransferase